MEPEANNSGNKNLLIAGVAVVIILVLVAGGYILLQNKNTAPAAQESQSAAPTSESSSSNPTISTTGTTYKDGTYTSEGDYTTHGGPESISVTLTLKNNTIDSVDVKSEAKDAMSQEMQGEFISGYKPMVVGKNIDSVTLSKVSGSSLTPLGFNDALTKIKAQAKS